MKRQVLQGTARKCPWVIEIRHQVAGRIDHGGFMPLKAMVFHLMYCGKPLMALSMAQFKLKNDQSGH